jgi:hypothetical protein
MSITGKRVQVVEWIYSGSCAVRVELPAIVPDEDPTEPCFEPETVRLLDRMQRWADGGDVDKLAKFGQVYIRQSA